MSEQTKCPACGAGPGFKAGGDWLEYRCLSLERVGKFDQSSTCRITQLERIAGVLLAACIAACGTIDPVRTDYTLIKTQLWAAIVEAEQAMGVKSGLVETIGRNPTE